MGGVLVNVIMQKILLIHRIQLVQHKIRSVRNAGSLSNYPRAYFESSFMRMKEEREEETEESRKCEGVVGCIRLRHSF
jgi:hypothetical protein